MTMIEPVVAAPSQHKPANAGPRHTNERSALKQNLSKVAMLKIIEGSPIHYGTSAYHFTMVSTYVRENQHYAMMLASRAIRI